MIDVDGRDIYDIVLEHVTQREILVYIYVYAIYFNFVILAHLSILPLSMFFSFLSFAVKILHHFAQGVRYDFVKFNKYRKRLFYGHYALVVFAALTVNQTNLNVNHVAPIFLILQTVLFSLLRYILINMLNYTKYEIQFDGKRMNCLLCVLYKSYICKKCTLGII